MIRRNLTTVALTLCAVFALTSCEGNNTNTPKKPDEVVSKEITNLDVHAYDKWTYLNLKTGKVTILDNTTPIIYMKGEEKPGKDANVPADGWHLAFHRYEVMTNDGVALDTGKTSLSEIKEQPKGDYKGDITVEYDPKKPGEYDMIVDLSKMMTGNVGFAKTFKINPVLWIIVDKKKTGSMPPVIYSANNRVFAVKYKDGSWAKIQVTAAKNTETDKTGWITLKYEFVTPGK